MKTVITIDIDGTEGLISEENCTGMKFKVPEDSPHREERIATSLLDYLLFEHKEGQE